MKLRKIQKQNVIVTSGAEYIRRNAAVFDLVNIDCGRLTAKQPLNYGGYSNIIYRKGYSKKSKVTITGIPNSQIIEVPPGNSSNKDGVMVIMPWNAEQPGYYIFYKLPLIQLAAKNRQIIKELQDISGRIDANMLDNPDKMFDYVKGILQRMAGMHTPQQRQFANVQPSPSESDETKNLIARNMALGGGR